MLNYVDIIDIVILFLILIGMSLSYNSNLADGLSGLASWLDHNGCLLPFHDGQRFLIAAALAVVGWP